MKFGPAFYIYLGPIHDFFVSFCRVTIDYLLSSFADPVMISHYVGE